MGKLKDIKGNIYGRLTVIEVTDMRKQGVVVWKCECICGEEILATRANLEQGYVQSCGCLARENVSERNKERQTQNLTNMRFGKLIAIEPTEERNNGYILWKCICDCGKPTLVTSHKLTSGNTTSCGCTKLKNASIYGSNNLKNFKQENYIAKTRLDIINKNKLNSNNTTGYTGIYLRKKDNKYISAIEFQGKRYFLGSYFHKEDAIKIRKLAEEKIYGEFLKWYNKYINKKNMGE